MNAPVWKRLVSPDQDGMALGLAAPKSSGIAEIAGFVTRLALLNNAGMSADAWGVVKESPLHVIINREILHKAGCAFKNIQIA